MTADQAKAVADVMAEVWEGEFPATCQVLAAVKDDNRDYKPDPKSRTAWQHATHLATADIWFLDSILTGAFAFDPEATKRAESQFGRVDDIVGFYKKTFPEKLKALCSMPPERMTETIDFFGMFQWPRARGVGFAKTTASTIADSWRPTCARRARRCQTSTGRALMPRKANNG